MKINKSNLVKFLELTALQGEVENTQVILNIESNKIQALTASAGNISMTNTVLKGEFDNIGQVGIPSVRKFIDFINNFEAKEINIEKEENHLVLTSDTDNLQISFILKSPEYIINTIGIEKFRNLAEQAKGNVFELSKGFIEKIRGYLGSIGTDNLYLKLENKELTCFLEANENSILASSKLEGNIKDFEIRVGKNLFDILNTIWDNINISLKNNCPILISYEKDNIEANYLLAQWKK